MKLDASMGVIQQGLPTVQLGKVSVYRKAYANNFEAPESLTGCGTENPRGLFTCTSALVMEVRPRVILEFQSYKLLLDDPFHHGYCQSTPELGASWSYAAIPGLDSGWCYLLFHLHPRLQFRDDRAYE